MEQKLVPVEHCTGCAACRARCPERAAGRNAISNDADGCDSRPSHSCPSAGSFCAVPHQSPRSRVREECGD